MELQLPMALQAALYVASGAIILMAAVLTVLLLRLRGQIERVVRVVEELKAEVNPLVQETRVVVETLRELTGQVENITHTARSWSRRANHLVEEIGSVVEPPVFAVSRKMHVLRKGLETFVRVLVNGTQHYQPR